MYIRSIPTIGDAVAQNQGWEDRSRRRELCLKYHQAHSARPYAQQWSLAFTLEIGSSQIVFYRIEEAQELLKVLLLKILYAQKA